MAAAQRQNAIRELTQRAGGFDEFARRVSGQEQRAALAQLQAMEQQAHQQQLDRDRLDAELETSHRRLDIDADRVQVEKAKVAVDALRVLVDGGIAPEQLLEVVREFNGQLLSGPITLKQIGQDPED